MDGNAGCGEGRGCHEGNRDCALQQQHHPLCVLWSTCALPFCYSARSLTPCLTCSLHFTRGLCSDRSKPPSMPAGMSTTGRKKKFLSLAEREQMKREEAARRAELREQKKKVWCRCRCRCRCRCVFSRVGVHHTRSRQQTALWCAASFACWTLLLQMKEERKKAREEEARRKREQREKEKQKQKLAKEQKKKKAQQQQQQQQGLVPDETLKHT